MSMNVKTWLKDRSENQYYRYSLGVNELTIRLTESGWLATVILNSEDAIRTMFDSDKKLDEAKLLAVQWAKGSCLA